MDTSDDRLDLLLADADEGRPVLEDGLPGEASQRGPKPRTTKAVRRDDDFDRRREDADPNDLTLQRWAVIAPEGREGEALLEAITPLIRLREAEQRVKAHIYRVPPEMSAQEAVGWKNSVYWAEGMHEDDRPLYALLLGDLQQVSLDLQHTLANGAMVGRIHFTREDGEADPDAYAAYAEKVVRFAKSGTPEPSPDLLFFVARDGTAATRIGERRLIGPGFAASKQACDEGKLPAASVRELSAETVDELLAAGSGERPSVLLSVSHGLGAPKRGWRNKHDEQRRRQGALVLRHDELLDAERMRDQRFLPGGIWFYLACFGAGTPRASVYHAWLSHLAEQGAYEGQVGAVLGSLPEPGGSPFVAALPQAALANPAGPLAVIGHMDLAWTYGFSNATNLSESRKSRIIEPLHVLVRGSRAGVALGKLMVSYRDVNHDLMESYQWEKDAEAQKRPDVTNHVERGHLWMLRNDLRGYVLLGDPAARLPLRQNALAAQKPAPAPVPEVKLSTTDAADVPLSVEEKEKAVCALMAAAVPIAERAGVSLDALLSWFDAYRAAGRTALGGS